MWLQVGRLEAALQQRDQALRQAAADVSAARTAAASAVELAQVRMALHMLSEKGRCPDDSYAT